MNKTVDARKKDCPIPVIMTKKELDTDFEGTITTIVDNYVARENVSKLAESQGYEFEVKEDGEDFHIIIDKTKKNSGEVEKKEDIADLTIAFTSNLMGSGDEKLGEILIKSLIYTISETKPYPKYMVFYNSGVKLTCKDSEVLEDLIKLKDAGVEIISCGTCLDFYNIKDDLEVGTISNMYTIYEKLSEVEKNISI